MNYSQLYQAHSLQHREGGQFVQTVADTDTGAAINGVVFTLRYPELPVQPAMKQNSMYAKRFAVTQLSVEWLTAVAFTVPLTSRGLMLVRFAPTALTAADPSGGDAFVPVRASNAAPLETLVSVMGTDGGAIATTGHTLQSNRLKFFTGADIGAAGSVKRIVYDLENPIFLYPGEGIAWRTTTTTGLAGAWDAAGQVRLNFGAEGCEIS